MKIIGREELLQILYNLEDNCNDIKGRDGEYLDVQVKAAIKSAENLDVEPWEDQ